MVFYEAKNYDDFKKAINFIKSQPELSFPRLCMNPVLKELTPEYAMKVITEGIDFGSDEAPIKGFYLFCAEDEKGNVRAVIFIRFKEIPDNPEYSRILHWAYCTVDNKDYENDDHRYFEELVVGMANKFGRGGVGEFRVAGKFYDWMRRIFPEQLKLMEQVSVKNYTTGELMEMWIVRITWDHLVR
jgi:hypothetical protein